MIDTFFCFTDSEQNGNITGKNRKGKLDENVPTPSPPSAKSRHRAGVGHARLAPAISRICGAAQRQPPADVSVNERGVPKFVPPIIEQSYCTSPAALCVELGEMVEDRPLGADLAEPDEAGGTERGS